MNDRRQHAARIFLRLSGIVALVGLVGGTYLVYRWAEPNPNAFRALGMSANTPDLAMRMDKTSYASYFGGAKSWAIWAERIDLLRPPGTVGLAALQHADLINIRDGKLFDLPDGQKAGGIAGRNAHGPHLAGTAPPNAVGNAVDARPVAVFAARQGHYSTGFPLSTPPELQLNYRVQWQFQLVGDVRFRTRDGDRLTAPSLTMLQLINLRTNRPERRILCDEGVQVNVNKARIQANSVRYDPAARQVECLGGVRGVFPTSHGNDTVQAERLFWSLNERAIRCPETASGTLNGLPFTAEGLNIDMKRHVSESTHLKLQLPPDRDSPVALP
jgi:hypothetical protein